MNILLIETSTAVCSVALSRDGVVVDSRTAVGTDAHSTCLPLFVRDLLPDALDAVCVSSGPGSYTGLRIGVSTAKGICYGRAIPLLAVPSLLSMAALFYMRSPSYRGLVCPMIDARRMECYTAIVSPDLQMLRPTGADVIVPGLYDTWLADSEVTFCGDGASKTEPILGGHPNARFDLALRPDAAGMSRLAADKLAHGAVEDTAYFEPYYLKDFLAKKSAVHGLR